MSNTITCPNCSTSFEPTAVMEQAITAKFKAEYNARWAAEKKKADELIRAREESLQKERLQFEESRKHTEEELSRRLQLAMDLKEKELQQSLSQKIGEGFEQKLRFLEDKKKESEEALKVSRTRELEFLQKEEAFKRREEAIELEQQKAIIAERTRIQEELRKTEEERFRHREEQSMLRMKEYELKLEEQKKLIEEMKRRSEQGSMQTQGEAQELILEELLRSAFPFDMVKEVGKGVRGADCILHVRNSFGQECGSIIFESKRTQSFGGDWIDKLKADMLNCKAEIAVIVSQVFPKDMDRFGERQGVYICSFSEVKSLVSVLRAAILKLHEARKSQENKGDKMIALYDYLTSSEFMAPWNTMRESFASFRGQLQKERDDFEKNWKKKEKMLDMIIRNSLQISGSIEGISGLDDMNWNALGEGGSLLIE